VSVGQEELGRTVSAPANKIQMPLVERPMGQGMTLSGVAIAMDEKTEFMQKVKINLELPVKINAEKVVVLLSGGIDSSTLLFNLKMNYECYPLSIIYGQKHSKETDAASKIAFAAGVVDRLRILKLPQLGKLLPSSLTDKDVPIPEGHYADESMKSTVVPNRNMILLAIAAGYAQGIGARFVAYAPHKGDHPIYPDCRPIFIDAVAKAIKLGTGWTYEGVQLLTPFSNFTKADIVKIGNALKVPFKDTWSCYKGGLKHCGKCGTCVERREAFVLAGVKDPTVYEE
jgi:7-cyano-7-deazaguanine synthase